MSRRLGLWHFTIFCLFLNKPPKLWPPLILRYTRPHTAWGAISLSTANPGQASVSEFIKRWESSGSAERANFHSFAKELCDLLAVPQPDPQRPNDRDNAYVFERSVHFDDGDGTQSTGWIDLYKRGCFVMEAKQGSDADDSAGGLFAPAQLTPTGKLHKGAAVRGTR